MALYSKCCIIDNTIFTTTRISSLYCSKKCRNKGRSIPPQMLQQLVQRQAQTVVVHQTIPRAVSDFIQKHGAQVIQNSIVQNPLVLAKEELDLMGVDKTDQYILLSEAKKIKGKKKMEEIKQERNYPQVDEDLVDPEMLAISGFGSKEPDPEMLKQQITISEENLPVITTADEKMNDILSKIKKPPVSTSKYKIKHFGE
jgi:hypothetical protein